MAERGGGGEGPQIAEGGRGGVLQDHHAGRGGLGVGEEGLQTGVGGLVQGGQARCRQAGHLGQGQPEVVQGEGELGLVEAAVVVGGHVLGGDEGVLGGRVDLHRQYLLQGVGRVVRRAVDLGQAAEAVRVLDPAERRGRPVLGADQLPHTAGDLGASPVRSGGVHGGGVRLVGAVDGEQREGADDLGGGDEATQFVQGQRRLAEGEGVAADEGEGVVVVERLRLGGAGAAPGMFPGQREAGLRERREVAGADRAELVHDRVGSALQRLAHRRDDGGPQAGPSREQLIGADGEHGPDLPGGQFLADGSRVAAQQAQTVFGGGVGGHVLVPVGAHAGGAAVDAAGRGDEPGGVPGLLGTLHGVGRGDRPRGSLGEAYDVLDAEPDPVEDDQAGVPTAAPREHDTRRVHDTRRHQARIPLNLDIRSCPSVIRYFGFTPTS